MYLFRIAAEAGAAAVVFYSQRADWCDLEGYDGTFGDIYDSYQWVYTSRSLNDTNWMIECIKTLGRNELTIGPANWDSPDANLSAPNVFVDHDNSTSGGNGQDSSDHNSQSNSNNSDDPSPSTAVAMIILYSITGIITALFLTIIITGAVRAHRHPERYGPSNVMGRPRQSRARGLARAMLDTIPIVKFGEREEPKPTDVELGDAHNHAAEPATAEEPRETRATEHGPSMASGTVGDSAPQQEAEDVPTVRSDATSERGIAAATAAPIVSGRDGDAAADRDKQECSICTDEFEIGQDQRVLPCGHRFHPECIDPWLLNVSGTCPLCRIDLRPPGSAEPEQNEHGHPVLQENGRDGADGAEGMAPPLALGGDSRLVGVGRTIRASLATLGRSGHMTSEEQAVALREYRGALAARQREQRDAIGQTAEEESGLRMRLRNAFRIRTRRTGEEDTAAQARAAEFEAARRQFDESERRRGTSDGSPGR